MVVTLLVSTFVIAFAVASLVVFIFTKPIDGILKRVVPADTTTLCYAMTCRFSRTV
jgi:hypothetical protein